MFKIRILKLARRMASGEQEDNGIEKTLQKLRDVTSQKMNLYGEIQSEFINLANEIKDHKRGQQFAGAIITLAAGMEELYGITHDLANMIAEDQIDRIRKKH